MSTKAEPGAFDGMEKAEPNEPVFTLRAHDPLASKLVLEWVEQKRQLIRASDMKPAKKKLELQQCVEAEEIAWAMKNWHDGVEDVEADLDDEKKAEGYSGHQDTDAEIAARKQYRTIKGAVSKMNNFVGEITDAADFLAEYGFGPERAIILLSVERVKSVSAFIAPKRASYYVGEPLPDGFAVSDGIITPAQIQQKVDELDGD